MAVAHDVSEYRVTGGPLWVNDERYDITAKPPAGSPAAAFMPPTAKAYSFPFPNLPGSTELLGMMQRLLAERFGLKVHRETRQLPVLALAAGKRTPKLEPARDPSGDWGGREGKEKDEWRNITMARLIAILEGHYRRPILDRTGLTGAYDFHLSYDPAIRDTTDGVELPADATGRSLEAALETQLGLILEETKGAVETLVIDEAKGETLQIANWRKASPRDPASTSTGRCTLFELQASCCCSAVRPIRFRRNQGRQAGAAGCSSG